MALWLAVGDEAGNWDLAGRWSLTAAIADPDPVQAELLDNLRWLAFHRRFGVVGVHGPADRIRTLHRGRDPAQALGVVYGLLAALLSMCRFAHYTVRLDEQDLTGGNVRFLSLRELAPE